MACKRSLRYCRNNVAYGNGMWLDFDIIVKELYGYNSLVFENYGNNNMYPFEVKYGVVNFLL